MLVDYDKSRLQPSLIEMVDILNAKHPEYVSTLDFISGGVLSPAAGIVRLKDRGLIIETETRSVIDQNGRKRKGIAFYKIAGVRS